MNIALIIIAIFSAVLSFFLFGLYHKSNEQLTKLQKNEETKIDKIELENQLKLQEQALRTELQQSYEIKLADEKKLNDQEVNGYRFNFENKLAQSEQDLKIRYQSLAEIELEKQKLALQRNLQQEEEIVRKRMLELQESIDRKEEQLTNKLDKLDRDKETLITFRSELDLKGTQLEQKSKELTELIDKQNTQISFELSKVAELTKDEARIQIKMESEKEMGEELLAWQQKYLANFEDRAFSQAKEITALAIQRCSSEVANEQTITAIKVENEADKGKLIGKQGRNIQWLEKTLGVELIIDDTPGAITISGFSAVRRHIAKRTIEKLLEDGRVHPASIEEKYEQSKSEIAEEIAEAGQWAVNELGIYDFPAKLIRLLGRLKFRTGYGQNVLRHSVEMARLAGLLADGLNADFPSKSLIIDRMVCVKGALLHDIGKGVDEEMSPKGNHIEIGEKVCDMFDLGWKVKKCISSHHTTGGDRQSYYDEATGQVCLEAAIVDACDTLSGGRPGARKETAEAYFQRMEALENIANSIQGVEKAWVMRGAREIWVFFRPDETTPSQMYRTTRKLARDINNSIQTPQEIKVIGFREERVVEYTR